MKTEKIANETWNNFHFPEWVPEKVQDQIREFWCEGFGRGPAEWMQNAQNNKSPLMGDRIRCFDFRGDKVDGRFIFAWNNIGRLIMDDGSYIVVGFHGFEVSRGGLWKTPTDKDFFTTNSDTFGTWYARYCADMDEE